MLPTQYATKTAEAMNLFLVSPATFAAPRVTVRLTTIPKKPVIEYLSRAESAISQPAASHERDHGACIEILQPLRGCIKYICQTSVPKQANIFLPSFRYRLWLFWPSIDLVQRSPEWYIFQLYETCPLEIFPNKEGGGHKTDIQIAANGPARAPVASCEDFIARGEQNQDAHRKCGRC